MMLMARRATWGSSGQAAAVFALSEAGATLADHGALGAGAPALVDSVMEKAWPSQSSVHYCGENAEHNK